MEFAPRFDCHGHVYERGYAGGTPHDATAEFIVGEFRTENLRCGD
jgi:hypothetical protein